MIGPRCSSGRRFGSVDTFVEVGDWTYRMGRPVANEGFLKALLTHGSFDAYEFFCPDTHHMERFMQKVEELVPDPRCVSRVRPNLQIALPEALSTTAYHAFHLGDFTYAMPRLVTLRNRLCATPFPVTGVTHSLDAVRMSMRYLELALCGLASWDGIVCTSLAAREAVGKGIQWASGRVAALGIDQGAFERPALEQIPLGIDEVFFEEGDRVQARNHLRIPEGVVVGLSLGRFSLRHKVDWSPVLELLARMEAGGRLDPFLLILAGGANDAEVRLLESLLARLGLEKRVLLFPNVPPEVKPILYRAADVFLSPVDNYQETFGLSIAEALASGLPVICSEFSGYRELVEPGETGWLIPTAAPQAMPRFLKEAFGALDPSLARLYRAQSVALDLRALEEALIAVLESEPLRNEMGRKARRAAKAFRWQAVISRYESLWMRLSKEASAAGRPAQPARADLLLGDPDLVFSHYPSRLLSGEHTLALTKVGEQALRGEASFTRYDDVSVCLFRELEDLILDCLRRAPCTVTEIEETAARRLAADSGQTRFHILWLMKHGALTPWEPPAGSA